MSIIWTQFFFNEITFLNQSSCCVFTVFRSAQFENSQKLRLINTFIKYRQCYSIHSQAWNTLHFYSCSHLQRGNKQDIIVNKGKEKKKKLTWINILWDKLILNLWSTKLEYKVKHLSIKLNSYCTKANEGLPAHTPLVCLTAGNSLLWATYWGKTVNIGWNLALWVSRGLKPKASSTLNHNVGLRTKKLFGLSRVTQEWEVLLNREGKRNGYFCFLLHPSQSNIGEKISQQKSTAYEEDQKIQRWNRQL